MACECDEEFTCTLHARLEAIEDSLAGIVTRLRALEEKADLLSVVSL